MSVALEISTNLEANQSSKSNTSQTNPPQPDASAITQEDLNHFYGTQHHFKHCLNQFVYTDGVRYLAQKARAYWLLDAIASYQPQLLKDRMLKEIQFWTLKVDTQKRTAKLICERDLGDVVITQVIEYTDFPLAEVKLYLANQVLMLPSEY